MIQSQILWTNIIRIVQQTVRRITNKILGVKGLRDQSIFIIGRGAMRSEDYGCVTIKSTWSPTDALCYPSDPPLLVVTYWSPFVLAENHVIPPEKSSDHPSPHCQTGVSPWKWKWNINTSLHPYKPIIFILSICFVQRLTHVWVESLWKPKYH